MEGPAKTTAAAGVAAALRPLDAILALQAEGSRQSGAPVRSNAAKPTLDALAGFGSALLSALGPRRAARGRLRVLRRGGERTEEDGLDRCHA